MPPLAQHQSNEYTKMLIMGDPGTGKTGGLAPLVQHYSLRILDMDNGLDPLKTFILRDYPTGINNVEYRTLRDEYKATSEGFAVAGTPKAFREAAKMLDRWKYVGDDGTEIDYGNPADWGPGVILVIDSLTFLSDAAFNYRAMLGRGNPDQRAIYKDAQDVVESVLAGITSPNFRTNVIVISHVKYMENADGKQKGYPTSVGSALSPVIPRYFNTVAHCETKSGGKRVIRTIASPMLDLKNPKPFEAAPEYEIKDGLAKFFATLRSGAPAHEERIASQPLAQPPKPTALTLKRR